MGTDTSADTSAGTGTGTGKGVATVTVTVTDTGTVTAKCRYGYRDSYMDRCVHTSTSRQKRRKWISFCWIM
jgi:hypothetical protein